MPRALATTAADGSFALQLAPGLTHQVTLDPAAPTHARGRLEVVAPGAGGSTALGDVPLDRAISVGGEIAVNGLGKAAGAHVSLFCDGCTGAEALSVIAEAITDASGEFSLAVPDPGVESP